MTLLDMRHQQARRTPQPDLKNWGILFLAMAALGATPGDAGPSGKLIGVVSGLLLVGLVLYQTYQLLLPLIEDGDRYLTWTISILVVLLLVKTLALLAFTGFGTDVGSYE